MITANLLKKHSGISSLKYQRLYPQWTDGKFGGVLEFDQENDEVNVFYHENLNQKDTFTVSAWANALVVEGHRAVVSCRDDFPQRGYIFYVTPDNTWMFIVGTGSEWAQIQGPAVNLGKWDHVAGVYADGTMKFYINGELIDEKDAKISVNPGQEFLIGAGKNESDKHDYFFKGKIDDVLVYDRELNKNEIAEVMKLGGKGFLPIEPSGKLTTTWTNLKLK